MKSIFLAMFFCVSLFSADYFSIDESSMAPDLRRGCCSHHKGVCGCESGRAKCCDGTLSPSCGCD